MQGQPSLTRTIRVFSFIQMHACLVALLCLTLCDPTDCSPPGFSVHGIFQARVLEWGAIAFSVNSIYLPLILKLRLRAAGSSV